VFSAVQCSAVGSGLSISSMQCQVPSLLFSRSTTTTRPLAKVTHNMLLSLLSVTLLGTLGEEEVEEEEEGIGSVDIGYAQTPTSAGMTDREEEETEDEDGG
jgi:hypothetical protein